MDENFGHEILIILLDKLAIGLLVLAAGFYLNRVLERFKSDQALRKGYEALRDETGLKYLERQIEELYSPLAGLIQYSRLVFEIAERKLHRLSGDFRGPERKQDEDVWRYFVETYFLPLNRQMADLIRAKINLIDSDDIPESFQHFLEHQAQYECLHRLWKEKAISSDEIPGKGWPSSFEHEVNSGLERLRREFNEFARRIKATG